MDFSFDVLYGRAVTIVGCIVLAFQLSFILRDLFCRLQVQDVPMATFTKRHLAKALSSQPVVVDMKARELAGRWHVDDSRRSMRLVERFFFGIGLLLVLARFQFGIWSSSYEGQNPADDTLLPVVFVVSFATMTREVPSLHTSRSVACLHVLIMARLVWQGMAANNTFSFLFRCHGFLVSRVLCAMILRNSVVTMVPNVTLTSILCCIYVSLSHGMSVVDQALPHGHMQYFIMQEVAACASVLVLVHGIDTRTLAEARATLLAKISHQTETTLTSILRALCDIVVRMSADFTIIEGSAQLKALLLRTDIKYSDDYDFMRLLDECDRKRFVEHMQNKHDSHVDGLATSLHLHLRDASGNRVRCQIFNACLHGLDDNISHILGLRELQHEEVQVDPYLVQLARTRAISDGTRCRNEFNDTPVGGTSHRQRLPEVCNKGTPANVGQEPIMDLEAPRTAASSSPERKTRLVHPHLLPTSEGGKEKSLTDLFFQWNFQMPRTSCCLWHTFILEARAVMKTLSYSKCGNPRLPNEVVQCKACGLLGDIEEASCMCVCGDGSYEALPNVFVSL